MSVSQLPGKPKEGIILFILAAIQFVNMIDFVIMMPLGPKLSQAFDLTPKQFGLLVSVYTFSASVFGLIASIFIDRVDRKTALLVLFIGFSGGTFLCAIAPTYELLMAARIFTGLFGGILSAMVYSFIADVIPIERRGKAIGIVMSAFSVASVVGIPLGLYFANLFSWHAPFLFLAILCVGILWMGWMYLPSIKGHLVNTKKITHDPFRLLKAVFTNRNQLMALGLVIMLNFSGFCVVPFIAKYMVANVKLTELELPYIYFTGGLFTFFTSRLVGRLSDKYNKSLVFVVIATISVIPLLSITNLPPVSLWVALIVTTVLFICNGARYVPAMALVTSSVELERRGSFMTISSAFQHMAAGFGSFIAGHIVRENKYKELMNFQTVGFISLAALLVCILLSMQIKEVK